MTAPVDVVVVGAGASGLVTWNRLTAAGLRVLCLEARDRIGGRMHTVYDPLSPIPIELGAEFIHGRPPEIWNLARRKALNIYSCTEHSLHIKDGAVEDRSDAWLLLDDLMSDMRTATHNGPDQSFAQFLGSQKLSGDARQMALSYVQGFNAADAERVGIKSLAADAESADAIDGDSSFRTQNGYSELARQLIPGPTSSSGDLSLNTIVKAIHWHTGFVEVHSVSALTGAPRVVQAKCAVITVPLGVLQATTDVQGSIYFQPKPESILHAAQQLAFGQVMRVVLRFTDPLWERRPEFADVGFLLSQEDGFPTWWTTLPMRAPIITGWSAGAYAETLLPKSRVEIIACALGCLSRVCCIPLPELEGSLQHAYFHDWHKDPFARGAYSYTPVGALPAREALCIPVEDTLFFAGEATETDGQSATVHGAMASGYRVAAQVLSALCR